MDIREGKTDAHADAAEIYTQPGSEVGKSGNKKIKLACAFFRVCGAQVCITDWQSQTVKKNNPRSRSGKKEDSWERNKKIHCQHSIWKRSFLRVKKTDDTGKYIDTVHICIHTNGKGYSSCLMHRLFGCGSTAALSFRSLLVRSVDVLRLTKRSYLSKPYRACVPISQPCLKESPSLVCECWGELI